MTRHPGPRVSSQRTVRTVSGIAVARTELLRWRDWLMPAEQPFVVSRSEAAGLGLVDGRARITDELRDSFWLYGGPGIRDAAICWVDRAAARRLSPATRHSQPAAHRWPTSRVDADLDRVVAAVERGDHRDRHGEVPASVWNAAHLLPDARRLAGRFPGRSGPNCFGAVMGAAGVAGAEDEWIQQDAFEQWLSARATPGGDDETPGTVMVWRDADGLAQHAAVVLGGWGLHKRSQAWMSPTVVLALHDVKMESRQAGRHLERQLLRC